MFGVLFHQHRLACALACCVVCVCLDLPGHGGSVKDTSGDEADNMDETLVPVDYRRTGQITDDVILKEVLLLLLR